MKQITSTPDEQPYKLVNYGIDTLVLNIRYEQEEEEEHPKKIELPEHLVQWLNDWQAVAKEQEEPVELPLVFDEKMHLFMYAHGAGKGQWRWLLNCPAFKLYVGRGRLNGVVAQVRFAASYLWSFQRTDTQRQDVWHPIALVCDWLDEFLSGGRGIIQAQVSEVHLCADVTGWDVSTCAWQTSFLSRARTRTDLAEEAGGPLKVVATGRKMSSLTFGTHGSALSCCIYNKSLEIKSSGKQWMEPLWKFYGWDGESIIWRFEFRWKREALHEIKQEGVFHGIETLEDLDRRMAFLWTYCAGHTQDREDGLPDGWLRYASPSRDTNMARWDVHPAWRVVQSAFCQQTEPAVNISTGEVCEVPVSPMAELIRQEQRKIDVRRLSLQVGGCLSTLSAWLSEENTKTPMNQEQVSAWLTKHLPGYSLPGLGKEKEQRISPQRMRAKYDKHFKQKAIDKQVLYGRRVKLEL